MVELVDYLIMVVVGEQVVVGFQGSGYVVIIGVY